MWNAHNSYHGDDDAMELDDERVLRDVADLRASNWQASSETIFEDFSTQQGVKYFVVLDSNVLVSYLPLVQSLFEAIVRERLPISLRLPSVVLAELNFLKERNQNPNTRALAQRANIWLLAQVRNRNGFLRGQQRHEKMKEEESKGRVNDDQIVDYCEYLLGTVQRSDGAVSLLSNDRNCCLKAELRGIVTISPKSQVTVESLLPLLTQSAHIQQETTSRPMQFTDPHQTHNSEPSMDLDEDNFLAPSLSHPLSVLHLELLDHLSQVLPHLAYAAALEEKQRRATVAEPAAPKKKSSLHASIHAPKSTTYDDIGERAFVMPTADEVQSWSILDCIHFALEFPPRVDGKAVDRRSPSIGTLKLFLLPYNKPGGRKGKDWSMGDWGVAMNELDQVAEYCHGWDSIRQSVAICRQRLNLT